MRVTRDDVSGLSNFKLRQTPRYIRVLFPQALLDFLRTPPRGGRERSPHARDTLNMARFVKV
jgi:hypothetical protein